MKMTRIGNQWSALGWHGWLFGSVLLLFGLLSAADLIMSMLYEGVYFQASGMTAEQIHYFSSFPLWVNAAWTASVFGTLLGSLALLLKHKVSSMLFASALFGNLLYGLYAYLLSPGVQAMGMLWFMPLVMTAITAAMVVYCHHAPARPRITHVCEGGLQL